MEIVAPNPRFLQSRMVKKPAKQFRPLYVGEWIEATGIPQKDVVKHTGISQSYISNMSGGRRVNPSAEFLYRISDYIGVIMNDFYEKPPEKSDVEWLGRLSPQTREALFKNRKNSA